MVKMNINTHLCKIIQKTFFFKKKTGYSLKSHFIYVALEFFCTSECQWNQLIFWSNVGNKRSFSTFRLDFDFQLIGVCFFIRFSGVFALKLIRNVCFCRMEIYLKKRKLYNFFSFRNEYMFYILITRPCT